MDLIESGVDWINSGQAFWSHMHTHIYQERARNDVRAYVCLLARLLVYKVVVNEHGNANEWGNERAHIMKCISITFLLKSIKLFPIEFDHSTKIDFELFGAYDEQKSPISSVREREREKIT